MPVSVSRALYNSGARTLSSGDLIDTAFGEISVGPVGFGADFDPSTNPEPGDATLTGCAAAIQAALTACVSAPYTVNTPARLLLMPAAMPCWVAAGATPTPFLIGSGRQRIFGAGMRASRIVLTGNTALAAITTPATGTPWTNTYGFPVILAIKVNGATMTGDGSTTFPVTVNSTHLKIPAGASTAATALSGASWTTFNGTVYVCVQNGGTVTLAYSSGTPTLTAYLAAFMANVNPSALGMVLNDFEVAPPASNALWARAIDLSSDPNNGVAYSETTKQVDISRIFSGKSTTATPNWPDYALNLDGCEGGVARSVDVESMSWQVPFGQATLEGGTITKAALMGQLVDIQGTAFQDASTVTGVTGITVNAVSAHQDMLLVPPTIIFSGYLNGSASGGAVVSGIVDNNSTGKGTNLELNGNYIQQTAGTSNPYISALSTTSISLSGPTTFNKVTSNPSALVGVAIASFAQAIPPTFVGAQTAVAFYANLAVGWAVTTPGFPGSTTTDIQNTTGSAVIITILTAGSGITGYSITDVQGTLQAVTGALAAGAQVYLANLEKIRFAFTGTPTWKWRALLVGS